MKINNTHDRKAVSLIELLVVITLLSILFSIGYTSYNSLKQENRRKDAQAALIALESKIQRYLTENNKAIFTNEDLNLERFINYESDSDNKITSSAGYYNIYIDLINNGEDGYRLYATANSTKSQYNDTDCRTFWIDHNSNKYATDADGNSNDATCWD